MTVGQASAYLLETIRTGVDESKNNALLATGATDSNWQITSITGGSDGSTPRSAVVVNREGGWYSGLPIDGTRIISRGTSYSAPGPYTYAYTYTFNVADPLHYNYGLGGSVWSDDSVSISLNGNTILNQSAVIYNKTPISFGYNANAGTANNYFSTGLNSLTFYVYNTGGGPTGLDVSGLLTATPEAAEWAMMLGGLALVSFFWRKDITGRFKTMATA
jgi:hypothetical protein